MINRLFFLSFLVALVSCSRNGNKNNDSIRKIDSITAKKVDSARLRHVKDSTDMTKMDSTLDDPDTAFSNHALEIIENFPECKLAEEYLDSVTHGSRGLQFTVFGTPTKDEPYYEIDVGNTVPDSGVANIEGHYETYMHFHVYNNHEHAVIKFYDIPEDKEYSLAGWRAKEEKPKKEGKKYYFFSVDEDYKY